MTQKSRDNPFRPFSRGELFRPFSVLLSKVKTASPLQRGITCPWEPTAPLHVLQSVMTECQCMHVVVQDLSLVICASHECLGLFLRCNIESLVVDALEAAFDHCVFLLLCL